jgi:hypothetical protein
MEVRELNQLFLDYLDNPNEQTKLAEEASSYVRIRMRETSFARKIMMPMPITASECVPSVNHDQLVKIVELEPNSMATTINFRGKPGAEYIVGQRYEIPFFGISSKEYQKVEEELMSYQMPITEIIENNSLKDLHAIEDEAFITKVKACITTSGKTEDVTAYNTPTVSGELTPKALVRLFNKLENSGKDSSGTDGEHYFDAKRYDTECILMNRMDWNKIMLWKASDHGDQFAGNVTLNGLTFPTLFGKRVIVTQKGELVPEGTIYGFAAKPYIGHAYILSDVKFYIKKERNLISWSLYEVIGYGLANAYAMASITFTNL